MATPQVFWYDVTNAAQKSSWDIGTVDAGSVSPDTTFLIWNNRAGASALSDMTACTISTKDSAGGNTGELVTNKWIEARVDSLNETTFTAVGGTVTKAIGGGSGAPAQTIKGTANDGNIATSATQQCFAKVTLHANVPATATAGNVSFLTRVAYQYV